MFKLNSSFKISSHQQVAVDKICDGVKNEKDQVLMGVTGSGKTFTMANVIQKTNMPALIMAPNKIFSE